jgi:hypothetical protein
MHSPEYRAHLSSPAWRATARSTLRLTKGRCALIPLLRASEAHHVSYRRLGHEWVWLDTIPLSWIGHKLVHLLPLWAYPMRGAVNAWLRLSAILVAIILRPLLLLAAVGLGFWLWSHYGDMATSAMDRARAATDSALPAWRP